MEARLQCLVSGYIRKEFVNKYKIINYPEALTIVFITFLGNIIYGFDVIHPDYKYIIQNYGKTLKLTTHSSNILVGSSYQFKSGIYTIVIEIVNDSTDPIGIHSNITCCKEIDEWIFTNIDDIFYVIYPEYICQSDAADKYYKNPNRMKTLLDTEFHAGDIVKLMIDCNDWKITYFVNEEQIGLPCNIVANLKYHLVICIQDHRPREYHIVSFDHTP